MWTKQSWECGQPNRFSRTIRILCMRRAKVWSHFQGSDSLRLDLGQISFVFGDRDAASYVEPCRRLRSQVTRCPTTQPIPIHFGTSSRALSHLAENVEHRSAQECALCVLNPGSPLAGVPWPACPYLSPTAVASWWKPGRHHARTTCLKSKKASAHVPCTEVRRGGVDARHGVDAL